MVERSNLRDAVDACDLLTENFAPSERDDIAKHTRTEIFAPGSNFNADAGWGEFAFDVTSGPTLVLPPKGETLAVLAKPTFPGNFPGHRLIIDRQGSGVFAWSSEVATGVTPLTKEATPISHSPVFNLESQIPQRAILVPSLREMIRILGLSEARVADILKAVNARADALLQDLNTRIQELDSKAILEAPNLSAALIDRIPTLGTPRREPLREGDEIHPALAHLHLVGNGAQGIYLDKEGRVLARVSTKVGEWHIPYGSRTIREQASGEGTFKSTDERGTHISVAVSTLDPAVIAVLNQQQALSAAHAAAHLWNLN